MDLRAVAAKQDGVVTVSQARAAGWSDTRIARALRSGRWRRVARGAYLVHPSRSTTELVVRARAQTLLHPGAVLAGTTAARRWGLEGCPDGPVEVVVPRRSTLRARADLRPHQWLLEPGDVTSWQGMPITTSARTLLDVVRGSSRIDALATLDEALRNGLVNKAQLRALAARAKGTPGSVHVEDLWALADGRAESRLESRVRFRCLEAGLVPDDLQVEIVDSAGRLLARVDMVFRRRSAGKDGWLVVEADGMAYHGSADAVARDRQRGNALVAMPHDLLRFTWVDTLTTGYIPEAIRRAL